MSVFSDAWKLAFQLSPIVLTNGIAQNIPGGMLPIIAITEAINFVDGLLSGPENITLDNFFASYQPLPGSTLIDQDIAHYPFANQAVAANAVITKPLAISMLMICPVRLPGGYPLKTATFLALQAALSQHNNSGGTYTIATPAQFYTNCLLMKMSDVTPGDSAQPQTHWQLDFEKPLLTEDQAQQAQNSLMNKISSGTQINGPLAWSGLGPTVGLPPSLATPGLIPAATSTAGAGLSAPQGPPIG
jgi:hypothetical protein